MGEQDQMPAEVMVETAAMAVKNGSPRSSLREFSILSSVAQELVVI
jgi:hypothetical protein